MEKFEALRDAEKAYFTDMVQRCRDSGAELVICQWGFDDEANHLLMHEVGKGRGETGEGGALLKCERVATCKHCNSNGAVRRPHPARAGPGGWRVRLVGYDHGLLV